MEGDEDDAIPLLRLRSWPEIPSEEMQQLTHAALSPSLQRLLLFQSSSQSAQLLSFRNSSLVSLGKTLTSFAWSCQQDCYTDASGPFQELLVACNDGGLLIYGFANRVSGTSSIDESTFEVNVNLSSDADKLKLVFLEAETWPEVVCFSVPCGSSSFARMVEFAYGPQQSEAIHHITKLFSSSCSDLVGMLMRQQTSDSDEGAGCRQAILIITITESEIRWVARVVLDADENWVDFALVFDKVLGLTLSGRIFIWEARTGSHLSILDIQRHCGTSDCASFLQLYPAEGRPLVGVTDKLGQIFLVSLDKHISDAGLESASSWEVANSDIWIFQSHEGRTSPGPSAFTAKRLLTSSQAPAKTKNLRKVVLPLVPSSSVGAVAIGYATITRLIRRDGYSILVQSRLHRSADTEDASRNLTGDVLGFSFQGSMYLVTAGSLSVVLPPVVAKGDRSHKETWWLSYSALPKMFSDISRFSGPVIALRRWQMSVLDRCLIYDRLEEAEHLAEENGWTVRFARLRKLQLALDYQRTDEIGQLLSQLVPLAAAESGILRVIFASVGLMVNQFGSDNELSQAARLLGVAARFTKELVKLYGNRKDAGEKHPARASASDDLTYLAQLLEVIRSLQDHLVSRRKRPKSDKGDVGNDAVDKLEKKNQFSGLSTSVEDSERALVGVGLSEEEEKRRDSSRESPKEMIARWEKDNVDVLGIVKDALRAGRIPLAVVQLHHRRYGSSRNRQPENDVFKEVQDVGRLIVYELFCKGKVPIALAALRRLGEDIQTVLRDLAFGTVRRSLRAHTTRELRRHGHLDSRDIRLIQTISRIEAVYPSSRFWSSYYIRQKGSSAVAASSPEKLQVCCYSKSRQFLVECGEIDGVVLGSWSTLVRNQNTEDEVPKDEPSGAYWAGALVWLQALDQETIDRIILDQAQASDIAWTSQLKYAVVHHSWSTVSSLINNIDPFELQESELEVHTGNGLEVKVPQIKRLTSDFKGCSGWLWRLTERELAQKYIFLRVVWTDIAEFLSLLSDASLIFLSYGTSEQPLQLAVPLDTVQTVHHFVVQHSVRYHLPWLLELYLDEHSLGLDSDILGIVGDCEWARWLLLSRQKGCEYDASFANARTVLTVHESKTISTLDDLAKFGSGLMALSTLMYAPALPQKCIYSRLKMSNGRSWQCALEFLRSSLKEFPTLWNSLKRFGRPAFDSALSTYLHWRSSLFSSANKETSLLLLLPKWLPKEFRKVLHVSIQGDSNADYISPASWEDCIRKKIEREILSNPIETSKSRVERYLLQGCAVAAFQYMVRLRTDSGKPGDFSPLEEAEEVLLGAVIPLAIRNFRNTVVTAACSLLLELCGVSSHILRTDLSALRRISDFIASDGTSGENIAMNLAQTLSEEYMQTGLASQAEKCCSPQILQHLERATIESISSDKNSCGVWLKTGEGDGQLLRTSQMSMSERWALVTNFCRVHQLPLSTVYLSYLARDNDWVGFLAEAQAEACPIEILLNVASKHFTDDQLQRHVLTVLKSLSSKQVSMADIFQDSPPGELFALLAEVEHHKTPGGNLLQKAKDLRWPLLAVVASCFNDVSALSCLATWLEITAERETSSIRISEGASHISACVGSAVDATNTNPQSNNHLPVFVRNGPKRRRLSSSETQEFSETNFSSIDTSPLNQKRGAADSTHESLARMVAVLCEQQRFIPLLRAFELFLPASPLLHFIRFLRAFSQMRLSEASAHLADFSAFLKEEIHSRGARTVTAWITKAADAGANAMLAACPSAYEKRCMLQLLAAAEFGDGGVAAMSYRKLYWKIQLAEPSLRQGTHSAVHVDDLDDDVLLKNLEQSGQWEDARSWARQLDLAQQSTSSFVHHVTEMQAEAMVTEWKELLWDVPEQRAALWRHCQALFTKHLYPPLKAGMFFLKHAEDIEQNGSPVELHAVLLLALQWLSGSITGSAPVYPVPLLRELETRVWLLAVESEVLMKTSSSNNSGYRLGALNLESSISMNSCGSPVDRTAAKIATVDGHLKVFSSIQHIDVIDEFRPALHSPTKQLNLRDAGPKPKRRLVRRIYNGVDKEQNVTHADIMKVNERKVTDEDVAPGWEEKVGEGEVERAILALVEVGQVSAARQLQQKLLPTRVPQELILAETAYSVAMLNSPTVKGSIRGSALGAPVMKTLNSLNLLKDISSASPLQVMEALTAACRDGCGRGHCRRVMAVAQVASFLGLPFFEAFQKQPTELLQLLSLKGQDALPEAKLLVNTHSINPASIARILAESFLKGLLAAHRGGYMDSSSKEEGPAPLLWRSSDFVQWAQLCPSEPELGHALMRLVISGHDMPHACEVELLILAHQFYESSACLDGMDVLVALAATRVESYVAEGDFAALARLVTGVSNFQALRFVLDLLIENGQLELLLKKRDAVDATKESSASVRGFRMAVLSALKHFNPHDLDAFGRVYSHFSMAHEMANLLESRGQKGLNHWFIRNDPDQNEELLDIMKFFADASEVYAGIDCGNKTRLCCAQASLLSLQLRMPELVWLNLTETNARRLLVDQRRFQEALVVAEAYGLNQPAEWVPVLWNQVLSPGWIEHFLSEFVASLPLRSSMLMELARIYRSEVSARGDHLDFSKWLTSGMPPEITKSFRCILKHVADFRLRMQLTTLASGFPDVHDVCARVLDKVPDTAGPLVLKRGHGGTYVPLM